MNCPAMKSASGHFSGGPALCGTRAMTSVRACDYTDGDLMGDGVNIAARLQGIAKPGGICISDDAYRQVKSRLDVKITDLGQSGKVAPPRLSLVVLPFANIGGDPEQDYFVDGVTERLTTRIRGSFVIGRNTAFTHKDKHVDLKQIGRELNVRYVLEGSIQRSGNRMRVNTQLIDAESGSHLWAERFDKPVAELFEMQDEIVSPLANTLNTQLITAEARRAERVPSPDSMDAYFQGMAWLNKGFIRNDLERAQTYFERALAIDPDNVCALASNAFANVQIVVSGFALTKGLRDSRWPKRLRPKPYPWPLTTLAPTGLLALSWLHE
jgi:TolB-like protein